MRKIILLALFLLFFLMFLPDAYAISSCEYISSSGYYTLDNDINATFCPVFEPCGCIEIDANNVVLDLQGHTIYGGFNNSVTAGITIYRSNITVRNGMVKNFNGRDAYGNLIFGLLESNYPSSQMANNINITNLIFENNSINVEINQVNNGNYILTIDSPTTKYGLVVNNVTNSSFTIFSRASTYAGVFQNIKNSVVSGHFDTNVIVQEEVPNTIGNVVSFITFGLVPANVFGTKIAQVQTKGIGLLIENSTNTVYKDISALGLVQGISTMFSNTNNTFAKIDLPLSGKLTGGKFGGIYLNPDTVNNTLCEVSGIILDDCGQLIMPSTCTEKNNYYFDSCFNVFSSTNFGSKQTIQDILLKPLYPQIYSPYYPFVAFLTTPFFLAMILITGASGYVAMKTEPKYGLFTLIFLVFITSMLSYTTFWFGLIFILIMSFVLIRYYVKSGEKSEE